MIPDGIVGQATWYAIVRLYVAVTSLAELRSQGQQFYSINWSPPTTLQTGNTGEKVRQLQYMLSVLSSHIPSIPPVTVDGIYGNNTKAAVLAAQRRFQLPETGTVGVQTWEAIYNQYAGIENISFRNEEIFPGNNNGTTRQNGRNRQAKTTTMRQYPGRPLTAGTRDTVKQEVVR